jgi:hypothetical protein
MDTKIDYSAVATSVKEKARDILRAQMAIRIQDRVQKAKDAVNGAIRHYCQLVVDHNKSEADETEAATKRATKRDAFTQALGSVPGLSADDLSAVTADITADRAEADAQRAEDAKADAKAYAESLVSATTRITDAQEALAHANDNLAKLNAGELKVDLEELKALATKLVEDSASAPNETV